MAKVFATITGFLLFSVVSSASLLDDLKDKSIRLSEPKNLSCFNKALYLANEKIVKRLAISAENTAEKLEDFEKAAISRLQKRAASLYSKEYFADTEGGFTVQEYRLVSVASQTVEGYLVTVRANYDDESTISYLFSNRKMSAPRLVVTHLSNQSPLVQFYCE